MTNSRDIVTTHSSQGVFSSIENFEAAQRMSRALTSSELVPKAYQGDENIGSALIALELAQRMNASPLMVMQNLDVIHGRPSWRSQMVIAAINSCGRFSPLRYEMSETAADEQIVEYTKYVWNDRERRKVPIKRQVSIRNRSCRAYAYEPGQQEPLCGTTVDLIMAVREGWYDRDGSKWVTMPELMLRYRAAAFWGRQYAPELLMGIPTVDETHEIIDVTPDVVVEDTKQKTTASVLVDKLKERISPAAKVSTPGTEPAARVTTPGAEPAAKVSTPGAEPAAKVSTPGAEPAAKVSTPGAEPAAKVSTPADEFPKQREDGIWIDFRELEFIPKIHGLSANGKPARTKSGHFRMKRGCDPREFRRIEAEALLALKAKQGTGVKVDQGPGQSQEQGKAEEAGSHAESGQAAGDVSAEDILRILADETEMDALGLLRDLARSLPAAQRVDVEKQIDARIQEVEAEVGQ